MGQTAKSYDSRSALGVVRLQGEGAPANAAFIELGVAPCDGVIVDVVQAQRVAGVGGNYAEFDLVRTRNGIAPLVITDVRGRITLAAGAAAVDLKKKLTLPAACVRPTILSSVKRVKKGDMLHAIAAYNGAYGTPPTSQIAIIIKPDV